MKSDDGSRRNKDFITMATRFITTQTGCRKSFKTMHAVELYCPSVIFSFKFKAERWAHSIFIAGLTPCKTETLKT